MDPAKVNAMNAFGGTLDGAVLKRADAHRRALWAVLAINAGMFIVESGAGIAAGSATLQANALDFLGDAANFIIALSVAGMAIRYRAMAALLRAVSMGAFGTWVVAAATWQALNGPWQGTSGHAAAMGVAGLAALLANAGSFGMLWAFRSADVNMRSAWIGKRNDVISALAVLLAAAGVFGSGSVWPDVIVALVMAGLALQGSATIFRQSIAELRLPPAVAAP
jgi:Co/Zn/Cd efflux system component